METGSIISTDVDLAALGLESSVGDGYKPPTPPVVEAPEVEVTPAAVGKSGLTWDSLFAQGTIVALHEKRWRARLQTDAADLGIDSTREVQDALTLGTCKLAPTEAFAAIQEAKHTADLAVAAHSCPFGLIRGARYVPNNQLPGLLEELEDAKGAYSLAVEAFVVGFEEMKAKHLPTIEAAFQKAAKTPEAARSAFERFRGAYPDTVRGEFRLSWDLYAVTAPKSALAKAVTGDGAEQAREAILGMVAGLRGEVQTKLDDLLALASKVDPDTGEAKRIGTKSVNAALETVAKIEALNKDVGDRGLGRQLEVLRRALKSASEYGATEMSERLAEVRGALEKGTEEAVAEVEARLTGVGQRKVDLS